MIPYLPQDTNPMDVPGFYRQIAENLESRGGHHENWHSHKRDPSVCWMCDLIELSKLVIGEMERFISKSTLDIETVIKDSEINSEDETVNYNVDDEVTVADTHEVTSDNSSEDI